MSSLRKELGLPPEVAARRLLGALLEHAGVTVQITEVEAYAGTDDPGSHAHRGPTARNQSMFGPPGRLYVYFTYGMHHCANVVVGAEGEPAAVLLRAGAVVAGLEAARERRPGAKDRDLCRGPARLCRALDLDRRHDGADLEGVDESEATGTRLRLAGQQPDQATGEVSIGPRVGLRLAAERPWRFWATGEPSVSTYRPAAPRRTR